MLSKKKSMQIIFIKFWKVSLGKMKYMMHTFAIALFLLSNKTKMNLS